MGVRTEAHVATPSRPRLVCWYLTPLTWSAAVLRAWETITWRDETKRWNSNFQFNVENTKCTFIIRRSAKLNNVLNKFNKKLCSRYSVFRGSIQRHWVNYQQVSFSGNLDFVLFPCIYIHSYSFLVRHHVCKVICLVFSLQRKCAMKCTCFHE